MEKSLPGRDCSTWNSSPAGAPRGGSYSSGPGSAATGWFDRTEACASAMSATSFASRRPRMATGPRPVGLEEAHSRDCAATRVPPGGVSLDDRIGERLLDSGAALDLPEWAFARDAVPAWP